MNAPVSSWPGPRYALPFLAIALAFLGFALRREPSSAPAEPLAAADARAVPDETVAELEYAADGLPLKPRDPEVAVPDGPVHPHPITDAHERIYRENNLVAALNLAVDLEDAARLRELVAQYRTEYPEDEHRLQEGYAIIADCLERLDASVQARARRFWETELRSQTRRYVRRLCLEESDAQPLARGERR
jgi:phytoene dehydrogenase-like protein